MFRYLGAAALLLAAGCLDLGVNANSITLPFDFNVTGENFTPGLANVATEAISGVNLVGELRNLPLPLDVNRKGLYLSGTNPGTDLFLYTQKYFTGFVANRRYRATLQVSYASNFHDGCAAGVGSGTRIKAGVSEFPLEAEEDNQGILRLNVDVGTPVTQGDFATLGDIRNGLTDCPATGVYATRASLIQTQDFEFRTDATGGFILWVGTHSNTAGRSEIYFTSLLLTVNPT